MVCRIMTVKIKREDAAERSWLLFAWNMNNAGDVAAGGRKT